MINEEILLKNGYKEYKVPAYSFANKFFQKKVVDDKGIKYFRDFFCYDETDTYECRVQFELKTFYYMNITRFGFDFDTTLEELELRADNLWKTQDCRYYETEDMDG